MLKAWTSGVQTTGGALDAGRGLAILAVFYGHALAPWFMQGEAYFSEAAYMQWRFGASFMMPFFFFVSGLAWRADKSLWATLRESITLVLIAIGASAALGSVTIIVNLAVAGLLRPALTRLRSMSRAVAVFVVEALRSLAARMPKRLTSDASSQA